MIPRGPKPEPPLIDEPLIVKDLHLGRALAIGILSGIVFWVLIVLVVLVIRALVLQLHA